MHPVEYIIISILKQSLLIFTHREMVAGNMTYLVIRNSFDSEEYLFLTLSYLNVKFQEEDLHAG